MIDTKLAYEGIKTLDQLHNDLMPYVICNKFTDKNLATSIDKFLSYISIKFQGLYSNENEDFFDQKLFNSAENIIRILEESCLNLTELEVTTTSQISLIKEFLNSLKNSKVDDIIKLDSPHLEELNKITYSIITNRFFR